MSTFHRNFSWANPPGVGQRPGNFIAPNAFQVDGVTAIAPLLIGAPIKVDTTQAVDSVYGLQPVIYAPAASAATPGLCGVAIYEYKNDEAYAGVDPNLTTFSDLATIPPAQALQMCSGPHVQVRFNNTAAITFLNNRAYPARTMVAGLGGATPTVVVGSYLTPGVGTDAAGYWAVGNQANGWLVVEAVDNTRNECVARFTF